MQDLYTAAGKTLTGVPWDVYPRPQMRRNSFLNLNGKWDFTVTDGEVPTAYTHTILVPFAPESLLSGVHARYSESKVLWYRRSFALPSGFVKDRVLLHFGAVDQIAEVFVNGEKVCKHVGGYHAFTVDITDRLAEENTIVVRVEDHLSDCILPYGKQKQKRGGMWYTPVSGIWQTVWLESVPTRYIRALTVDTEGDTVRIAADGVENAEITVGDITVTQDNAFVKIRLPSPHFWSPEDPYLYSFTVTAGEDRVESYFALRDLTVAEYGGIPRLCLNGKPYFFNGVLDQGYFSDGLFTPAVPEEYERDILRMKQLGFNMLRKHIKVEPEQFYYACDRLGMVVFQDMVNNGNYSFLRDTALPTVGLKRLPNLFRHVGKEKRDAFAREMEQTVAQLYNHPCICYWTVFNEGWGQFAANAMYRRLFMQDCTRFIDTTSGWFAASATDVDSRHVYFRKVKLRKSKKPLVLSEFGGYTWKAEGHVFHPQKSYGYRQFASREDFVKALQALYTEEILPAVETGLCAAVYTQLSDVEDEINGLVSYDRAVEKVFAEELLPILQSIQEKCKNIPTDLGLTNSKKTV